MAGRPGGREGVVALDAGEADVDVGFGLQGFGRLFGRLVGEGEDAGVGELLADLARDVVGDVEFGADVAALAGAERLALRALAEVEAVVHGDRDLRPRRVGAELRLRAAGDLLAAARVGHAELLLGALLLGLAPGEPFGMLGEGLGAAEAGHRLRKVVLAVSAPFGLDGAGVHVAVDADLGFPVGMRPGAFAVRLPHLEEGGVRDVQRVGNGKVADSRHRLVAGRPEAAAEFLKQAVDGVERAARPLAGDEEGLTVRRAEADLLRALRLIRVADANRGGGGGDVGDDLEWRARHFAEILGEFLRGVGNRRGGGGGRGDDGLRLAVRGDLHGAGGGSRQRRKRQSKARPNY